MALEPEESGRMRKVTWWNVDASGHTLHLGLSPKVNNVQEAIWLRLARGGGAEGGSRGSSGWREGLQRAQAYGKADFSSPCSS